MPWSTCLGGPRISSRSASAYRGVEVQDLFSYVGTFFVGAGGEEGESALSLILEGAFLGARLQSLQLEVLLPCPCPARKNPRYIVGILEASKVCLGLMPPHLNLSEPLALT